MEKRAGLLAPNKDDILHEIKPRDTLFGLSLKYNISVQTIKLANDLTTDNLATVPGGYLRIPLSGPIKKEESTALTNAAILRKFRVTHNISEPEAKYYLESCDYDYNRAELMLANDVSFEKRNSSSFNSKIKDALQSAEQSDWKRRNAEEELAWKQQAIADSKENAVEAEEFELLPKLDKPSFSSIRKRH
jgi:LysM domain